MCVFILEVAAGCGLNYFIYLIYLVFIVVDIDVKNGKDGRRWERYHDLPLTRKIQTASGGDHFYFKHPGRKVTSNSDIIFEGVDIKGDGGYVICPPSDGYSIVLDEDIAEMPDWLVELCIAPKATEQKSKAVGLGLSLGFDSEKALNEITSQDGSWHDKVLRLTGHWISRGLSDGEMLVFAPVITWPGYSPEQTRREMKNMIDSGREKWDLPGPVHASVAATKCQGFTLGEVQAWDLKPARMFNDWLPEGLTLLGGRPKAGKSWLAERASFQIGQQESVLHFALEYGPLMLHERMRDYGNVSAPHLKLYHEGALVRLDNGGLDQLKNEVEAVQAKLVVIDTFAKVKRPGDAKGYEAEYQAMEDLKRLVVETGVTVLALHHTRKPSHQDTGSIFDTFLGSSALAAVPDNLLIFDDRDVTPKLHGRGRLIEEFQFPLRWADPGFEVDEPDAALREKAPLQYQIKTRLRSAGPMSNKELASVFGRSGSGIANATRKLIDSGEVQRMLDGLLRVDE